MSDPWIFITMNLILKVPDSGHSLLISQVLLGLDFFVKIHIFVVGS